MEIGDTVPDLRSRVLKSRKFPGTLKPAHTENVVGFSIAEAPVNSEQLLRPARIGDITRVAARHAPLAVGQTSIASVALLQPQPTIAHEYVLVEQRMQDIPEAIIEPAAVTGAVFRPRPETSRDSARSLPGGFPHGAPSDDIESLLLSLLPHLLPPPRADVASHGGLDVPEPLYAFQARGISFLLGTTPGALLADDMGLGKTVQAIVALRHLVATGQVGKAVVVAPKAVITSWARHLAYWAPELNLAMMTGDPRQRNAQWRLLEAGRFDVGIITYDVLRLDLEAADGRVPALDLLIADEVQRIKNPTTKTARAMRQLTANRRWGLTGTPLENHIGELATILGFLDRRATFDPLDDAARDKHVERMMLRRRRTEVLDDLPDLISNVVYVTMGPTQRAAYEKAEREGIAELRGAELTIPNVLALITRLKQICNAVGPHSAKLEWTTEYVETAAAEGDKLLVVSQFVETLAMIEPKLEEHGALKYVGSLTQPQRDRQIKAFETQDVHKVMLLSLKAGGVGLNLQAANHVIHFDSWWNPAVQDQATARAHRLGQAKDVFVNMLVATDTIEERIQQILSDKRELFDRVVDDFSVEGLSQPLTQQEIYSLVGLDDALTGG